ncbi:hypothetical protein HZZ00_37730 (plasmid) [Streptomyces sp. NEAU-sy36]|uniref:hypothetical protein n=1 Tax=unclassified Streptomyces TaxID=2593676 RepID=UPI0015D5ECC6|nr:MULTISPECIES: hypothetical protein [unclassified Streptomyces]QLJ06773.1 hypothetical protein HZZ00_37730 [Streptomyces sp. NEAU-sy36]
MTEIPTAGSVEGNVVDAEEAAAFEVMCADAVLGGRAVSSGQFLAGLLAEAELATVGRPEKLPADLFPDADPAVVQAVWDRALAVGFHAGRMSAAPRLFRDQMDRVAGLFEVAGWHAMAGMVRRSRALVAPTRKGLSADSEIEREH